MVRDCFGGYTWPQKWWLQCFPQENACPLEPILEPILGTQRTWWWPYKIEIGLNCDRFTNQTNRVVLVVGGGYPKVMAGYLYFTQMNIHAEKNIVDSMCLQNSWTNTDSSLHATSPARERLCSTSKSSWFKRQSQGFSIYFLKSGLCCNACQFSGQSAHNVLAPHQNVLWDMLKCCTQKSGASNKPKWSHM